MGYGLEELNDTESDALNDALILDALGHRISYEEYENQMPWDTVRALLDLRGGRAARRSGEATANAAFGQIITTPPEG